jgi:polyisoprenoid-binding protein YceI
MRTNKPDLAGGTWTIDTSATTAEFTVGNFVLNKVGGTIDVRNASVQVDAGGRARLVEAVLEAGTFHTGNSKRDADICSKKFLDAERFPEIRYASHSITSTDDGWTADGQLFVGEYAAPLVLTIKVVASDVEGMTVEASGTFDRVAAGLRAPSFLIGREVDVRVRARLVLSVRLAGCHPALSV